MARCNLSELDGLGSLTSLKELYLAFNQITSLDPISMLENLTVLDIEANLVSDPTQIEYLVFCPNLKSLTLIDNPINFDSVIQEETTADIQIRNRHIISTLIPQLEILDDIPLEIEKNIVQPTDCQASPVIIQKPVEKSIIRRPVSVTSIKRPIPPSIFNYVNQFSIIYY